MLDLEYFYYERVETDLLDRKIYIKNQKTILFGANGVGKKSIALKYIKDLNLPFLYIDFNDLRIDFLELKNIEIFIKEKNIEVVLFANFDFSIDIPNTKYQIITTNIYKKLENFDFIEVYPLDFEEFISFEKQTKITNIFNDFIKYGNLPILFDGKNNIKRYLNRYYLEQICADNTELNILKILINSVNSKKSIFFLFNQLKKNIKISKDKFYRCVDSFQDKNIIYFIEKFDHPKSEKKIFCYSPTMVNLVSINKQFNNIFANFIFLELYFKDKDIFYLDDIDFYLPNQQKIVLAIPFFNDIILNNISNNIIKHIKQYSIKHIDIVTINQIEDVFIDNIKCEVTPFYEWALR